MTKKQVDQFFEEMMDFADEVVNLEGLPVAFRLNFAVSTYHYVDRLKMVRKHLAEQSDNQPSLFENQGVTTSKENQGMAVPKQNENGL